MRMVFVPIRIRYLSVYRCNRLASSLQAKTGGEGIKLGAKTVLLAVLTLGIGAAASVQYGRGRVPRYDASTEVTVSGTVQHLQEEGIARWGTGGAHLILNTGSGRLLVRLGPRRFLSQQHFRLSDGDRIQVTGSKVKIGDEEAILAREVRLNDRILTLRDKRGKPQWPSAARGGF